MPPPPQHPSSLIIPSIYNCVTRENEKVPSRVDGLKFSNFPTCQFNSFLFSFIFHPFLSRYVSVWPPCVSDIRWNFMTPSVTWNDPQCCHHARRSRTAVWRSEMPNCLKSGRSVLWPQSGAFGRNCTSSHMIWNTSADSDRTMGRKMARIGDNKNAYKVLARNPESKTPFLTPRCRRIIIKCTLNK